MGYKLVGLEEIPESIRNKPGWVSCLVLTFAVLIVTASTITIGALFGYTYCYIEHRSNAGTGNVTHSTSVQIIGVPYPDTKEARYNRTINGALISSLMVSRIMNISPNMKDEDFSSVPVLEM